MKKNYPLSLTILAVLFFVSAGMSDNCAYHKSDSKKGSTIESNEIKTGEAKSKQDYYTRFPEISQSELVKLIKKKAVFLVDANSSQTYRENHIPGAVHLKGAKFEKKLPKDKNTLIVAYCGGPGCSAWNKAADKLDELGYKNIRHYKGGIREWVSAGLDIGRVDDEG